MTIKYFHTDLLKPNFLHCLSDITQVMSLYILLNALTAPNVSGTVMIMCGGNHMFAVSLLMFIISKVPVLTMYTDVAEMIIFDNYPHCI